MKATGAKWYRHLQVQLWLWAILPLTLVLVAVTFTGVYSHQRAMLDFVAERDLAMARLYAWQIGDALAHGLVSLDGRELPLIVGDAVLGERGVVYVIDTEGKVLFHPNRDMLGANLRQDPAVEHALSATAGTAAGRWPDGSATLASFATVTETQWRVLVEEPTADIIVPILRFSGVLPVLVGAAGVLSLIVIYFSLRTIVQPLQRLADSAAQVTGADLELWHADVGGVEEIRSLQQAFRAMVERIHHYQQSLRQYLDAMTKGQESERARLSRELHDATAQDLIAASQRLELAQHALERGDTEAVLASLRQTRELCHAMLADLRRVVRALRPAYLEDLGLLPSLETLLQEVRDRGLSAEMLVHGAPRRLQADVELTAFRVVQEALHNVVQHAQAQQVAVTVWFAQHEITLVVEDDGVGFTPPESLDALTQVHHFGLVGMRERIQLSSGELNVDSQPNAGTRITVRLPA